MERACKIAAAGCGITLGGFMLIIINTIGVLILIAVIVRVLVTGNWLYEQHWFRRFCVFSLNKNLFLQIGPESWKSHYIAFLLGGMLGARPIKESGTPKSLKSAGMPTDVDLSDFSDGKDIIKKVDEMLVKAVHDQAKADTEYIKSKEKTKKGK